MAVKNDWMSTERWSSRRTSNRSKSDKKGRGLPCRIRWVSKSSRAQNKLSVHSVSVRSAHSSALRSAGILHAHQIVPAHDANIFPKSLVLLQSLQKPVWRILWVLILYVCMYVCMYVCKLLNECVVWAWMCVGMRKTSASGGACSQIRWSAPRAAHTS